MRKCKQSDPHSLKIEEYLGELKGKFNNKEDYLKAVNFLKDFFQSGKVNISQPLFIKSGNIRKLAFALGEIWRSQKNEPITYEYLCLYKHLFTIFKDQKIDKKSMFGCNLYKYSISKT